MYSTPLSGDWEPRTAAGAASLFELGDVHVFLMHLDHPTRPAAELAATLNAEERQRASRFRFAVDQRRFEAARGLLRHVLGYYTGAAPEAVRFQYSASGKPAIAGGDNTTALAFNLSHSGAYALLGLTRAAAIGVDIEVSRIIADHEGIAKGNFAEAECNELFRLAPTRRRDGFLACWTRKEAYVKALGHGLLAPLDQFVVSVDPDAPAKLVSIGGSSTAATAWTLWAKRPTTDSWAALVVSGRPLRVCSFSLV
ncbi:MAG: 4'-phosphopantetheinyl transferase superfamily protein [Burkholderiales bacterium]